MKLLFNRNKPPAERIDFLEVVVARLARRVHKQVVSIIPPHVMSTCATGEDIRGDIYKAMLFKGTITKGIVCFNKRPKNPIHIEIKILNNEIGFTKSYYVSKMRENVDLDIATIDGSMISVSVYPTVETDKLTEVWISLLWSPDVSNTKVKNYLIESLEKAAEDVALIE
ncbi:MAG: hypothetical protein KKD77_22665 [Gammaproteobacteria bacterium]|nr:hypothetical protein [Gammaproteobacteria bacterium]